MTHLWVRAEQRPNEERVGLTPEGAAALVRAGIRVTVEQSSVRAIPIMAIARQVARLLLKTFGRRHRVTRSSSG